MQPSSGTISSDSHLDLFDYGALWFHYIGKVVFPSLHGVHLDSDVDIHKIFEDLKEDPLHKRLITCLEVQVLLESSQMGGNVKEVRMQMVKGLLSNGQKENLKSLNGSR